MTSNDEFRTFVHAASHDLREPIRKILTFSEFLGEELEGQLTPDAAQYLGVIRDAAGRMQAQLDALLAYGRVYSRGKPLEPADLGALVARAVGSLAPRDREHVTCAVDAPLPVLADPDQVVGALHALLDNALRFTPDGAAPRVDLHARRSGARTVLEIADEGIGLEPRFSEEVFEPFRRLHPRNAYPGVGMGLTFARSVARRHGGEVRLLRAAPGEGASFVFELPCPPEAG